MTTELWDELSVEELEDRFSPICGWGGGGGGGGFIVVRGKIGIVPTSTCFSGASGCM